MRSLIDQFAKLCLTVAIFVAMASSGFAHRTASQPLDESLIAYVATGGALDDLCGDAGLGASGGTTCDACRLVDTAMVPPKGTLALTQTRPRFLGSPLNAMPAPINQVANPACPVRAPPVV